MAGDGPTRRVRLSVDLGGTHLRAAAVASDGQILTHARQATPKASWQAVVRAIVRSIAAVTDELAPDDRAAIAPGPIVVATPGPFDAAAGRILDTPNLPHLRGFALAGAVASALNRDAADVVLRNDATMAALGEAVHGAGRGYGTVLFLTISTGIGGGLVVDGKPFLGAAGQAAELGHLIVDGRPGAPTCGAGHAGCLEAHASGTAIARAASAAGMTGPDGAPPTAADVAAAARTGDATALDVLAEAARWLGLGIASAMNAFDPAIVVLGGGVMEAWPLLRDGVLAGIEANAMSDGWRAGGVVRGALGDDAGLVGAACEGVARIV